LVQPFVCCPAAFAQAVELAQTSQAENPADGEPGLNMPSGEPVAVNKTLPQFTPPGKFALSANPSDDEITRCGLFAEPLVPSRPGSSGGEADSENTALARALKRYAARTESEDVSALCDFCTQNAESRWEAAMQHNLGLIAYHQGYFSQALAHWEQAWETGKKATQFQAVALANESLAQLMHMNARLGRMERIKALLAEAEDRRLTGNAASMLSDTNDALALMENDPSHSFRCGPLALAQIRASLKIRDDNPVGYRPPVGPAVCFVATYSQRESGQPATFTFSNLGANWVHDWMAYVQDNPTSPKADAQLFVRGGGYETLTDYVSDTPTAGTYGWDLQSNTVVQRVSNTQYKGHFRDGSLEIYGQPDKITGPGRHVFLTQIIDPRGNALTLTYDSQFRLVAVKDAIGQVTTLSYGLAGDIYKTTKVTDPFGRYATLNYTSVNGVYILTSIQDVIGIVSSFTYQGSFMSELTTPYGNTTFSFAQGFGPNGTGRSLDAVDPLGGHERTEYNQLVADAFSDSVVPAGMNLFNAYLYDRDTYFWSKEAMMQAPGDYTKAKQYHFQHTPDGQTAGLLESVREGLESRVWRNYPGQGSSGFQAGITIGLPSLVGRVLNAGGTTQLDQYSYNDIGNVTRHIDPQGRTTNSTYAANQIDLTRVQVLRGSAIDTVMTAIYNTQHLPLTLKDASGQTTTSTYNVSGELTSMTDAKGEVNKFVYNASGYLLQVINSRNGLAASFIFDGFGRVKTYTNAEGYTVSYTYDALDRVTQVSYPDGTADKMAYTDLDLTQSTDRQNRVTVYAYNALRQLTGVTDPLARQTQYAYCTCGALNSITDAKGNVTQFFA
jgi:YD repeat-containing protein